MGVKNRVGEVSFNTNGSKMIIINYRKAIDIDVLFEDSGYIAKNKRYSTFKTGEIKNPFDRSVYGIGFLGEGKYTPTIGNKITEQYRAWRDMLNRCYSESRLKKFPSYRGCIVCDEWHNFQNFAKWYHENFYEVDGEVMCLDKDILIKNNKVYSPETCVFVPNCINTLFIGSNATRGECFKGVTWHKRDKVYQARCNNRGELVHIGSYITQEEAFKKYKEYKENLIKEIANEYKYKIPRRLYEAMYNYKVEKED